jgi:hypothetical protein
MTFHNSRTVTDTRHILAAKIKLLDVTPGISECRICCCNHLVILMTAYSIAVELSQCIAFHFMQIFFLPCLSINLLKPTGHVMHQQFNIQQLYVLPTLYLCVLYLSENKQRLVPLTA